MDDLSFPSPFADISGGSADYEAMNKGVTPMFFVQPVKDEKASEDEGVARFREQEMVMIVVAGDTLNRATSPVDDKIKARFADHYARWKRDRAAKHIEGTPLREWPLLSSVQVAELSAASIESVEQLAGLSDSNVVRVQNGREWRAKAAAWLDSAKKGATSAKLAGENERLKQKIAQQDDAIAAMQAQIAALSQQRAA